MRLRPLLLACTWIIGLAGCAGSQQDGLLRKPASSDARNAARIHTELGQHYLQQGMLKRALQKLQTALRFDKDYAPAHTVIAVLYQRIGQLKEAEKNYRRAVELEPKQGAANNNLGVFLCQRGHAQASLKYFRRALADPFYQTPDNALSNKGICLLKLNRNDQAEADFRKALRLNPSNADALYHVAALFYQRGDIFHASVLMQRFQALGQTTPDALLLGYRIASRLGNKDEAKDFARRIRAQFPDSDQASALDDREEPKHDASQEP